MTQYGTDFSEYSTGAQPSDWTATWATTGTWTVETVAGATGGQALQCVLGAVSGTGDHCALRWDDPGTTVGDMEVLIKARSSVNDNAIFAAVVRGADAVEASRTGYQGLNHEGTPDQMRIRKIVTSTETDLATVSYAYTADVWLWIRIRISGSDIEVTHWEDGGSEPGSPTLTASDSAIASGWAGVAIYVENSTFQFDFVGVGTEGDTAPSSPTGGGGGGGGSARRALLGVG